MDDGTSPQGQHASPLSHKPDSGRQETTRFWRVPELDGLEILRGAYQNEHFPRHLHEEYVLSVMTDGAEVLNCRGSTYTAPAGTVLLLNPGEWHANYAQGPAGYAYWTIYPSVSLLQSSVRKITDTEGDAPLLGGAPVIHDESLRQSLLSLHCAVERQASALELEAHFLECTACLLPHSTSAKLTAYDTTSGINQVRIVREYLEARYAQTITLSELAARVQISPFHLLRLFRDQVGLPPHEYQTHLRIAGAKTLLRQGHSVSEVALAMGFADQSHLTRHFRRIVGITPARFAAGARTFKKSHRGRA